MGGCLLLNVETSSKQTLSPIMFFPQRMLNHFNTKYRPHHLPTPLILVVLSNLPCLRPSN